MQQINLDGGLSLPPIDSIATARPSAKQDRPAFDQHLQRASSPSRADENSRTRRDDPPANAPPANAQSSDDKPADNATRQGAPIANSGATNKPEAKDKRDDQTDDTEEASTTPQTAEAKPLKAPEVKAKPTTGEQPAIEELAKVAGKQPKGQAKPSASNVAKEPTNTNALAPEVAAAEQQPADVPAAETTADENQQSKSTDATSFKRVQTTTLVKAEQKAPAKPATDESAVAAVEPVTEDSEKKSDGSKSRDIKTATDAKSTHVAAVAQQQQQQQASAAADATADAATQAAAVATAQAVAAVQSDADRREDGSDRRSNPNADAIAAVADKSVKTNNDNATPPATAVSARNLLDSASHGTSRSGETSNVSESDRVRFVQRVSRAFQTAADRGGSLRLRLSPPELGAIKMEVSVRDGVLSARLEAETPAARTMLIDNLPELRQKLADHNIQIDKFDVELMGQGFDGARDNPTDTTADRQLAGTLGQNRLAKATNTASEAAAPTKAPRGDGRLNVVI